MYYRFIYHALTRHATVPHTIITVVFRDLPFVELPFSIFGLTSLVSPYVKMTMRSCTPLTLVCSSNPGNHAETPGTSQTDHAEWCLHSFLSTVCHVVNVKVRILKMYHQAPR